MSDYIQVRLGDNLPDKAVLVYDATEDRLVDSGLVAQDGDIQAAAGTVKVGLQHMSSAGEQVSFRNTNSAINYAPPWHIIDEVSPGGSFDRFYGPLQIIERATDKSASLANPAFDFEVTHDVVGYRLQFETPKPHPACEIKVTQNDKDVWRKITPLSTGVNLLALDVPLAFRIGTYNVSFSPVGTEAPVEILGNPQTGVIAYTEYLRDFVEKPLATKEYVESTSRESLVARSLLVEPNDRLVQSATSDVPVALPLRVSYFYGDNTGDFNVVNNSLAIDVEGVYRFDISLVVKSEDIGSLSSWLQYSEDDGNTWEDVSYNGTYVAGVHNTTHLYYPSYSAFHQVNKGDRFRVVIQTDTTQDEIAVYAKGEGGTLPSVPGGCLIATYIST